MSYWSGFADARDSFGELASAEFSLKRDGGGARKRRKSWLTGRATKLRLQGRDNLNRSCTETDCESGKENLPTTHQQIRNPSADFRHISPVSPPISCRRNNLPLHENKNSAEFSRVSPVSPLVSCRGNNTPLQENKNPADFSHISPGSPLVSCRKNNLPLQENKSPADFSHISPVSPPVSCRRNNVPLQENRSSADFSHISPVSPSVSCRKKNVPLQENKNPADFSYISPVSLLVSCRRNNLPLQENKSPADFSHISPVSPPISCRRNNVPVQENKSPADFSHISPVSPPVSCRKSDNRPFSVGGISAVSAGRGEVMLDPGGSSYNQAACGIEGSEIRQSSLAVCRRLFSNATVDISSGVSDELHDQLLLSSGVATGLPCVGGDLPGGSSAVSGHGFAYVQEDAGCRRLETISLSQQRRRLEALHSPRRLFPKDIICDESSSVSDWLHQINISPEKVASTGPSTLPSAPSSVSKIPPKRNSWAGRLLRLRRRRLSDHRLQVHYRQKTGQPPRPPPEGCLCLRVQESIRLGEVCVVSASAEREGRVFLLCPADQCSSLQARDRLVFLTEPWFEVKFGSATLYLPLKLNVFTGNSV